eukprot:TRINITY_DN117_c1_g1_i3.p1 TRINITY_DN117_c1_g1~~TRINITY_DN117_c1_g1_i3.p1  ORF type:complete len:759 (+),score=144.66 TRINITY_DN117_c1_g1_i3:158-2434(+)
MSSSSRAGGGYDTALIAITTLAVGGATAALLYTNYMKKHAAVDKDGLTNLMLACKQASSSSSSSSSSSYDTVRDLVSVRAVRARINQKDNIGWNALHWASFGGNEKIVRLLLDEFGHELNVNILNGAQWTSLHVATAAHHAEVVKVLVERGGADINCQTPDDHTPFLIACCNGKIDIAEYLLAFGADPTLSTKKLESPLYYAALNGHENVVNMLLKLDKKRADHLCSFANIHGATPLHGVCGAQDVPSSVSVVASLLEAGADPNAQKRDGCTPLHIAVIKGSINIMNALLKAPGINVDLRSRFGTTAAHEAAAQGRLECLRALVEHGADLTIRDNDGYVPLHTLCASQRGTDEDRIAMIRWLVTSKGAVDINAARDKGNSTALHLAACGGERGLAIIPVLLELGADLTIENRQKWTALHHACSNIGLPKARALLEEHAFEKLPEFWASFDATKPRHIWRDEGDVSEPGKVTPDQARNVNQGRPIALEDVATRIRDGTYRNIVILVGAGMSVSSGIPDFRSPSSGLYTPEAAAKYGVQSVADVFDPRYLAQHPDHFYNIARDIFYPVYTGAIQPTPAHRVIKRLCDMGRVRRIFTQNIDGLEFKAGIPRDLVVEAHGGFGTGRCMACAAPVTEEGDMWGPVGRGEVPKCKQCGGIVRPDVVFFGEGLPKLFHQLSLQDMRSCDLLLVLGTSLKVYPFAALVNDVPDTTPRVLFNLEETGPFQGWKDASEAEKTIGKYYRDCAVLGPCDDGMNNLSSLLL